MKTEIQRANLTIAETEYRFFQIFYRLRLSVQLQLQFVGTALVRDVFQLQRIDSLLHVISIFQHFAFKSAFHSI